MSLAQVEFLPIEIISTTDRVIDKLDLTKDRLFGGTKTDTYAKFELQANLRVSFLYKASSISGFLERPIQSANLVILGKSGFGSWRTLGETASIPLNMLSLSAFTDESASLKVGELSVRRAVPRRYLYALGFALRDSLRSEGVSIDHMKLAIAVNLEFVDGNSKIVIEATDSDLDRSELLGHLKLSGISRYFSPFFYIHNLRRALAPIVNKCSALFSTQIGR